MDGKLALEKFLPYRLSIASYMVSDVIADAYRSMFDFSVPEWRLVTVLAQRGHASQFELRAATRMDKVTVSRAAAALVSRALVDRSPNPEDQRSHRLALTESGRSLYAEIAPKALELERELLTGFSPQEVSALGAMLVRLEKAAAKVARS